MKTTDIANLTAFTFFSANLSKLLPQVPLADHSARFNEAGRYHRMAHERGNDEHALKDLRGGSQIRDALETPGIIGTFHVGAYKILPLWLISCGVPLTLLVSADIAANERETYRSHSLRFAPEVQGSFEILEAEDPLVIRKMVRSIDKGNWVMVFLDGNEGAATNKSGTGRRDMVIDFLAHRLRVKTGVAELAFMARCPIYPMVFLFDEQFNPKLMRLPTIGYSGGLRQNVVRSTIETLYAWLAVMIDQSPMQWEGWFYVHHDLQHRDEADHRSVFQHFLPFSVHGHRFVLHRETYDVYPASDRTFLKLCDYYDRHVLGNV